MKNEKPSFWDETIGLINFFYVNNRSFSETAIKMQAYEQGLHFDEPSFWKYVEELVSLGAIRKQEFSNVSGNVELDINVNDDEATLKEKLRKFAAFKKSTNKLDPTVAFKRTRAFWKVSYPVHGTVKEHKLRLKQKRQYTPLDTLLWRKQIGS